VSLTLFQQPSSVNYEFCSGDVLVLPSALPYLQHHIAYGDEAKDALSIIDSSSSSTEWDTPLASEVFLGGFGIKDRHSLSSQRYSPIEGKTHGREVTWANTVDSNT
jgi:hypothetical protein